MRLALFGGHGPTILGIHFLGDRIGRLKIFLLKIRLGPLQWQLSNHRTIAINNLRRDMRYDQVSICSKAAASFGQALIGYDF